MMTKLSTHRGFKQEILLLTIHSQWTSRSDQQVFESHVAKDCGQEYVKLEYRDFLCVMGLPNFHKNRFTPFQLVYGVETILLIECKISSLKLAVEFF